MQANRVQMTLTEKIACPPVSSPCAPLLIVVFNRPDKTRALVDQLLQFEGLDVLVAADGPRGEDDRSKCAAVRAIIGELSSRHMLQTRFAESNIGCGAHVIGAIRWAFEQFDSLIIIEDDIRITAEFLDFCNHGLERYRHREDILCISSGPLVNLNKLLYPQLFMTRYPNIWGWATWREKFSNYSLSLDNYSDSAIRHVLKATFPSWITRSYFYMLLQLIRSGRIDGWDFQYYFMAWAQRGFSVTPARNLAENIGFDAEATHMKRAPENVGQIGRSVDADMLDPVQSLAVSADYDRMIERDLWHINLYQVLRFVIKYIVTKPKRYRLPAP